MSNDITYGKNAVESLLDENKRQVNKILLAKGIKYDAKIQKIIGIAKKRGIVIQEAPREKLNTLADGVHQGIIASVAPIKYINLEDFLNKIDTTSNSNTVIILDSVEDPHNLGSIIRTAACAGVKAVIIPARRASQVNSTVEKASAGTVDKIDIIQATNISKTIEKLKENNFWIIGAESSGTKNYFDVDYNMNCAIVMGGENQGISKLVTKNCDIIAKIPILGNVNSLNVANATSIMIYEIVRQRIKST